jgi:hypothetical protein
LLLVKKFLHLKTIKSHDQALSTTFHKLFSFNEDFMPKMPCEYEYHARFLLGLFGATENSGGGGGLLLAHCGERYSLQAAEVRKAQFHLGFSALMQNSEHTLNCRTEKG